LLGFRFPIYAEDAASNALTLLVGRLEGHPASKNFCFKTPWVDGYCKWVGRIPIGPKYPVGNHMWLLQKKDMKSFWPVP